MYGRMLRLLRNIQCRNLIGSRNHPLFNNFGVFLSILPHHQCQPPQTYRHCCHLQLCRSYPNKRRSHLHIIRLHLPTKHTTTNAQHIHTILHDNALTHIRPTPTPNTNVQDGHKHARPSAIPLNHNTTHQCHQRKAHRIH